MVTEAQQIPHHFWEGKETKDKLLKIFTPQEESRKPSKLKGLVGTIRRSIKETVTWEKVTAPIPIPQDFIKRLQNVHDDNALFWVLREILASADDTTDENTSSESQRSQIVRMIWEPVISCGRCTENGIDIICDEAAVDKGWYPDTKFLQRLLWAPTALVAKALRSLIEHERIYRPEQIETLTKLLFEHEHVRELPKTDDGVVVMKWLHDKMGKVN